jgi:hypothetical protein
MLTVAHSFKVIVEEAVGSNPENAANFSIARHPPGIGADHATRSRNFQAWTFQSTNTPQWAAVAHMATRRDDVLFHVLEDHQEYRWKDRK